MNSPFKIVQNLRQKVQAVTYGSPLYRMMLDQGGAPTSLLFAIPDLWPGDAEEGHALLASRPGLFDRDKTQGPSFFARRATHSWLRDLRAVGTESARRKACALIESWLEQQDRWQDIVWSPAILGKRLANWIAFYDFYGPLASDALHEALWPSLARQMRHLLHTLPVAPAGLTSLAAIKGLVYGGLAYMEREKALGLAFDLLQRQVEAEILPDGGHISRNPSTHLVFLCTLIDIREALRAAQLEIPPELALAIQRMLPVIKFFRHGDGRFGLFNGAREEKTLLLDAAMTLSGARARALRRLPQMGYERVTAGRSLLLVDIGAPPPRPYDETAHAGLLSFEFSVGRERLIVNCGAGPRDDRAWHQATAATAAHSTVTLQDTNACALLAEGGLAGAQILDAQRYEKDGTHVIELSHDGYTKNMQTTASRVLQLSADGDQLIGCEILTGLAGVPFAIRWHLHPLIQVSLIQDGSAALLRAPSGAGWRLSLDKEQMPLVLEPSVYCGTAAPRRTLQLKACGQTQNRKTTVTWRLIREKPKGKGPSL